jgi:D-glycero-D-manno-heptose 1,7-bisphosphate phosphatase
MFQKIRKNGGIIDAFYYCPHRPDESCSCRKPNPQLFYEAAEDYGFELSGVYYIGDYETDVLAAQRAGCRSMLVKTGRGLKTLFVDNIKPDIVVENLLDASEFLTKKGKDK